MTKRLGFKPTFKATLRANNAADRFYAAMAGVEPQAQNEGVDIDAAHKKRAAPRQLEAPVVAAISELLAVHPNVLFAVRQNSGSASYEAKSGKWAPVAFYRILTHGKELTLPDFWGLIFTPPGGSAARMLAIEAKAPGWTKPRDERERRQANFLALVRTAGGRAGFATNVDEARRIIES